MKRIKIGLVLIMMFLLVGCSQEVVEVERTITNEQWNEDIDYIVKQLKVMHPNPFLNIAEADFMKAVEHLKNDVPQLRETHIELRIIELLALLKDAHTNYVFDYPSGYYPLALRYFENDLRVLGIATEQERLLGAKLTAINTIPLSTIESKLDTLISYENEQWSKANRPSKIISKDMLEFLGIIDTDEVEFTFVTESEEEVTIKLTAMPYEDVNFIYYKREQLPLRSKRPNTGDPNYWYTYLSEQDTLYFKYDVALPREYEPLQILISELETLIGSKKGEMKKLIIDLRTNEGGNSSGFTTLATKFKRLQEQYPFDVSVLMGEMTFSAGTTAAIEAKQYLNATLIGEETGGNAKAFGNGPTQQTPNAKQTFIISTDFFNLGTSDRGFLPDITVIETFEDYKKGIDKQLEAALN